MPNLVVNAGPGTGKSYTCKKVPKYLRASNITSFLKATQHTQEQIDIWQWVKDNVEFSRKPSLLYCAYNADTVKEIKPEMPPENSPYGVEVRTIHGCGYKVLNRKYGYIRMNSSRGTNIVQEITGHNIFSQKFKDRFKWLASVKYFAKLKDELKAPTPENLQEMQDKYDDLVNFPIHEDMPDQIEQLVRKTKHIDRADGIEYVDQIWLALFLVKNPIYDLGIVDECQDLSRSRLALVRRLCRNLIFVGDPDQAINAFAGADSDAFTRIREVCDKELPLKLSFRNPPNIVQKANHLMMQRVIPDKRVPLRGVKKTPGKEEAINFSELPTHLEEPLGSNLLVCRYNAPLFKTAFRLGMEGIPSVILGKSIADNLLHIIKNRKAESIEDLHVKLKRYEEYCLQRATNESIKQVITDKHECLYYVLKQCSHYDDIEDVLRSMFAEKPNIPHVTLCTIHKAKGKERKNVYVLFPPIESEYAKTEEQKQQEQNLHFVAMTRVQENYYIVNED